MPPKHQHGGEKDGNGDFGGSSSRSSSESDESDENNAGNQGTCNYNAMSANVMLIQLSGSSLPKYFN